jgi:hypothetical protein
MVYVQERTNRRSSVLNDAVRRIPNLKVPPSRITVSKLNLQIGKIVSTRKLASSLKHMPSAKETNLLGIPSIPATPSSKLHAKLDCSPLHVSKRRESRVINSKPAVSKITHQKNETRSKVPEPAVNPRIGTALLAFSVREPQQSKRAVK